MLYRFKKSTLRYREGQEVEFDPKHLHTQQRIDRGIIEPVNPAKKRSKKVVEPDEVKDDRSDD